MTFQLSDIYCVETQAKAIGLSVILSWRYEGDTLRETTAGLVHVMLTAFSISR